MGRRERKSFWRCSASSPLKKGSRKDRRAAAVWIGWRHVDGASRGSASADVAVGYGTRAFAWAPVLREAQRAAGGGEIRPTRRADVRGVFRGRRQARTSVDRAGSVLPDALRRLLRRDRVGARSGVAMRGLAVTA